MGNVSLYAGMAGGRSIRVVSATAGTPLAQLDLLAARSLSAPGTTGLIYSDYRKHQSLEPLAIYENGALVYYNPLYAASPPVRSANREVVQPIYMPGGRVGAVCFDGSRSSSTGRGACSHHGGVASWRYEQILDPNALLATVCGDYLLRAGPSDCDLHLGSLLAIRQGDLRSLDPPESSRGAKDRFAGLEKLELDHASIELHELLNEWIFSDIPIEPFRVLRVPALDRLPVDPETLLAFLPPEHRSLVSDLGLGDFDRSEGVEGFDLLQRCGYHEGWGEKRPSSLTERVQAASNSFFRGRVLDLMEGSGYYDGPYPFGFDWMVALDRKDRLLFSFILNLED